MSVTSKCDPELRGKNGQVVGEFAKWWEVYGCTDEGVGWEGIAAHSIDYEWVKTR